jgi:hypothetical protein
MFAYGMTIPKEGAAMRSAAFALAFTVSCAIAADGVRLDRPLSIPGSDDCLSYDDGSAYWLAWGGLYRGVWFNLYDFGIGGGGWSAGDTEYWFYHHSSYPWDTASFYGEMYNGDSTGPAAQLDQTSVTAVHYSAVYACYSPSVSAEDNFWVLINTEMSGGGWPSALGDPAPGLVYHSFFSDDFIVWEPWVSGDFFIRTSWCDLAPETWGSIKVLYSN